MYPSLLAVFLIIVFYYSIGSVESLALVSIAAIAKVL